MRQLGQIPDFPGPWNCGPDEQFNMSTMQCEPLAYPGYTPPADPTDPADYIPPGGVTDRPCTPYEVQLGICPTGTLPAVVPPQYGPPDVTPSGGVCDCQAEAQAAYDRGKKQEQANVVKTAAISAAVSAAVGIAIGWLLGS